VALDAPLSIGYDADMGSGQDSSRVGRRLPPRQPVASRAPLSAAKLAACAKAGATKSEAKARTARENGRLGGRDAGAVILRREDFRRLLAMACMWSEGFARRREAPTDDDADLIARMVAKRDRSKNRGPRDARSREVLTPAGGQISHEPREA
jgi:hypothetical protein